MRSFPVRERGLKQMLQGLLDQMKESFPVRERGLKLILEQTLNRIFHVVPRAGTWIETHPVSFPAWHPVQSFPVRERGLKHMIIFIILKKICRSPCGNVD